MKVKMEKEASNKHTFASKWSSAIEQHGFVAVPNLLLQNRRILGLTVPEVYTLICIDSFRWDRRDPFPSLRSIASRARLTQRTVRRHISSLEKKSYIKRKYRSYQTTKYDIQPMIEKLDSLAISSLPPGKKEPPGEDKINHITRSKLSSKEDPGKQDAAKRTSNKKEVKSAWEIARYKYQRPP